MTIETDLANVVAGQTALLAAVGGLPDQVRQSFLSAASDVILFVNPVTGNDASLGLAASPVRTIAGALRLCPPNRGAQIYLAPGQVHPISLAEFPALAGVGTGGRISLRNQTIGIYGPFRADASQRPIVRFIGGVDAATGASCPRFTGTGQVIFGSCRVEVAPLDPAVVPGAPAYGLGIASGEQGGVLNMAYFEGELVLSDMPAHVSQGGVFSLNLQGVTVSFMAGKSGYKLLRLVANAPTLYSHLGGSAPVAYSAMTDNPGGLVSTGTRPYGLLTNVVYP